VVRPMQAAKVKGFEIFLEVTINNMKKKYTFRILAKTTITMCKKRK